MGIVRNIDDLGRITIPIEARRFLGIKNGDELMYYYSGEEIILMKPKKTEAKSEK